MNGRDWPIVIGHRGAAGYRPENTLESYELAARLGADFIEPDLVSTADGVLVCRHEPEIGATTDVVAHPEFAPRRKTRAVDGVPVTGWFTEDFTLAELRTLRAKERLPLLRPQNTRWDGQLMVPTFQEVLDLRAWLCQELGREVGVYPEVKRPTDSRELGLPLERSLYDLLRRNGLDRADAPVYVQCFEPSSLRELRDLGLTAPAIQLVSATGAPYATVIAGKGPTFAELVTPSGLGVVAGYAQGVGMDKLLIIPREPGGGLGTPTSMVAHVRAAGLVLHAYTFRAENAFLPADYQSGSPALPHEFGQGAEEQVAYLEAGVDGLFTDQADLGVLARERYLTLRGLARRS